MQEVLVQVFVFVLMERGRRPSLATRDPNGGEDIGGLSSFPLNKFGGKRPFSYMNMTI